MKNVILYVTVLALFLSSNLFAQEQIDVSGTITENGVPLPGVNIYVKGTTNGTTTDFDGNYTLKNVSSDAILVCSYSGFSNEEIPVKGQSEINFDLEEKYTLETKATSAFVGGSSSISPNNYWIGAKIGYNFIGETDDNFFVGSASVEMNPFSKSEKKRFAIIGNFGNFKFDGDTNDSENVQKVTQSINGLSIGLGYTVESKNLIDSEEGSLFFRKFIQSKIRLTSFKNIGDNQETINLAQSVTTGGLELELGRFENGGTISFSTGVSLYLFDPDIYQQIFDTDKKSLVALDFTLILPISKNMGLFTNGTFSKDASANYILGIIFKP